MNQQNSNISTGPRSAQVEQLTGRNQNASQAQPDDPDVPAITSEQQVSTKTFIDQRQIVREQTIIPSTLSRTKHLREQSMPEMGHTIESTFVVPYLVANFNWTTSDTLGTTVWSTQVPSILNSVPAPARAMLRTFAYYKADFVLRFQLNSTKFHQGRLLCAWYPMNHHLTDPNAINTYQSINQPHVQLDAADSSVAEIHIPYQTIYNFLTTNTNLQTDSLGTIVVSVLNPLLVTGSSTSVSIGVYMYAADTSLHVPIEDHTPVLNLALQSGSVSEISKNPLVDGGSAAFDDLGGAILKLVKSVGASAIGLDHPADPTTMTRGVSKALSSIAAGSGIDHVEVLDTVPLNDHNQTPSQRGIAGDEMNLRQVVKRPSLFNIITWSTSQSPGDSLGHWAVSPLTVGSSSVVGPPVTYRICPTFLAYVTQCYAYWKGGIRYRFEVVGTKFHTGRILVAWIPNVINYSNTPNLAPASAYPSEIFDLQQRSEFEIVVPYDASTSWKKTNNINANGLYDPNNPSLFNAPTAFECYNGYFVMMVQSRLVAPSNVASSVQINCYISGDDDFYCRALTDVGNATTIYPPLPEIPEDPEFEEDIPDSYRFKTLRLQSKLVSGGARQSSPSFWNGGLGTSYQSTPADLTVGQTGAKAQFGDVQLTQKEQGSILKANEMDLHWILSKYILRGWQNLGAFRHVSLMSPVTPIRNTVPINTDYTDLISRFGLMYVFWTGSINHKILMNTNKNQSIMGYILHNVSPSAEFPTITDGTGSFASGTGTPKIGDLTLHAQAINFAFQDCFEVCTPMKTIYDRMLTLPDTSQISDPYARSSGVLQIIIQDAVTPSSIYLNHFMSIGNDFQFMFMVSPPVLRYDG